MGWVIMMRVFFMEYRLPFVPPACSTGGRTVGEGNTGQHQAHVPIRPDPPASHRPASEGCTKLRGLRPRHARAK